MKDEHEPRNCKYEWRKKCLPRPLRRAVSTVLPSTAGWDPDKPGGLWHPNKSGGPWHLHRAGVLWHPDVTGGLWQPEARGISPGLALPWRILSCQARVLPRHQSQIHGAPGLPPGAAAPLRTPAG